MATLIQTSGQSLAETKIWDCDFTNYLPTGVTVSSATAVHYPPSGTASTPTVGTIVSNVVPVTLSGLTVKGTHYLRVLGTLSNGEVHEMRLIIPVNF